MLSQKFGGAKIAEPVQQLMASLEAGKTSSPRMILGKLVEFVRVFSFSGIVILIDKVDETEATQTSSDMSASLVHPILSHIQLLEVDGFSWVFFLWARIKPYFESDKYPVRLDKIAHSTIEWEDRFFAAMLDTRLEYFSGKKWKFKDLFQANVDLESIVRALIELTMRSPRELVRLMDVIVAEHDIRCGNQKGPVLLDADAVDLGMDKYVRETISYAYPDKVLNQIFRLQRIIFINKDVQSVFKIGDQSARNRIRGWSDAGIVKQTGTRSAEGDFGGKPASEFSIVDARVARIVKRSLIQLEEIELDVDADEGDDNQKR